MKKQFIIFFIALFKITITSAMPINNDTALFVAQGQALIREQGQFTKKANDPTPMNRVIHVFALRSVFLYGITEKISLLGKYPLLHKRLKLTIDSKRITRKATGFGDLTVLTKYRFFKRDKPAETIRSALFGGLKFPTGSTHKCDCLGELPRPLQPGTGSWDPIVGGVFTWQTLRQQIDIALQYKFNTRNRNFTFGDSFRHDISYQRRIWSSESSEKGTDIPSYLYAVLEANGIFNQKNKSCNIIDNNSGGYTLFISPGVQYVSKRFIIEASVQAPAIQKLNGKQPKTRFIAVAGFRVLI